MKAKDPEIGNAVAEAVTKPPRNKGLVRQRYSYDRPIYARLTPIRGQPEHTRHTLNLAPMPKLRHRRPDPRRRPLPQMILQLEMSPRPALPHRVQHRDLRRMQLCTPASVNRRCWVCRPAPWRRAIQNHAAHFVARFRSHQYAAGIPTTPARIMRTEPMPVSVSRESIMRPSFRGASLRAQPQSGRRTCCPARPLPVLLA